MARTGLAARDPKYLAIKAIIESEPGMRAVTVSAANGIPPVCGVDKLLRDIIVNYSDDDQSIKCAGSLIAEMLRAEGYGKGPLRPCPAGCNAKRGTVWIPPGIRQTRDACMGGLGR
jgi:hypothetical protein